MTWFLLLLIFSQVSALYLLQKNTTKHLQNGQTYHPEFSVIVCGNETDTCPQRETFVIKVTSQQRCSPYLQTVWPSHCAKYRICTTTQDKLSCPNTSYSGVNTFETLTAKVEVYSNLNFSLLLTDTLSVNVTWGLELQLQTKSQLKSEPELEPIGKLNTGLIVGLICGGVGLTIIIAVGVLLYKKKKAQKGNTSYVNLP